MKYFLLLTLLVVKLASAQSATVQKPIECTETQILLRGLGSSDYKEKPIWWGIESETALSRYSLFVNDQTKTWTLIQFNETLACILGTGENSSRVFQQVKK
jgi:hypothetical protein